MKSHLKTLAVVLTGIALFSFHTSRGVEKKPKYTVSEVMKAVHKGEDNIGKRVLKGVASREDIASMVEHYESLPVNEPPRGDKQSWAAKTGKLLAAAKAVKAGSPAAIDQYKEASNCKACHSVHKPEEKK